MRCVDVNVLIYAHRPESPDHDQYRSWLENARISPEPLAVPSIVERGFLRVVTHPRIFKEPSPTTIAIDFLDGLRSSPATVTVEPSPRHWEIFTAFVRHVTATGNGIPDAYLAALAVDLGATWYSSDRGFARFPELRWRHPIDE